MVINKYYVDALSSPVQGTELVLIGDTDEQLVALNEAFDNSGTINGLTLKFPLDVMAPYVRPNNAACWVYGNEGEEVFLGRSGDSDYLDVFVCRDRGVGDAILGIGPCIPTWGDPMRALTRSWFHECARLSEDNLPYGTGTMLTALLADLKRQRAEPAEVTDGADEEWPMVMVMGLPHLHPRDPRVRASMARMGLRHRVEEGDPHGEGYRPHGRPPGQTHVG